MVGIAGSLIILQVAGGTIGAKRRILSVHVAGGAGYRNVRPRKRKLGLAVVERCAGPIGGRMAQLALLREARGDVIRLGGALKILQMAT